MTQLFSGATGKMQICGFDVWIFTIIYVNHAPHVGPRAVSKWVNVEVSK